MIWLEVLLWILFIIYFLGFVVTFAFAFYVKCALVSLVTATKLDAREYFDIICKSFWKSLIWPMTWRRIL